MQGWTLVPAFQHALSPAHGAFLKVPATRQEGCRQQRPQSSWHLVGPEGSPAGPSGLYVVLGHESEKHHCDTNSVNYDFWGQAVAYD